MVGSENVHEHLGNQHRDGGNDSKAGSAQNKSNAHTTRETNRVQRAWGRYAYCTMTKKHSNVRSKYKVSLRTRLRRLNCETKPSDGTDSHLDHSWNGESGGYISEGESQMSEKEVTHQHQVTNEHHHVECYWGHL